MAVKYPIVLNNGKLEEIQSNDTLDTTNIPAGIDSYKISNNTNDFYYTFTSSENNVQATFNRIDRLLYHEFISDVTTSSTTSTTFQTKLSLTTKKLELGFYAVFWNYEWNYSNGTRNFRGRVTVNGSVFAEHIQEPQEILGQSHPTSGFFIYKNVIDGLILTIKIEYASSNVADTASIKNAQLLIKRIN